MRKTHKIMILIGAVGLIISLITFGMGASTAMYFDSSGVKLTPRTANRMQHTVTEIVTAVEVNSRNVNILVNAGEDFSVESEYMAEEPAISVRNGVLVVDFNSKWHFNIGFIFSNSEELTVTIPNGMLERLRVSNNNGRIVVENVNASEVSISNDNGNISISDVNTNFSNIKNNNGRIKVERLTGERLNMKNGNGGIIVEDVDSDTIDITNQNGSIRAENITGRVTVRNSNGSIKFARITGEYYLDLMTRNGSVKVEGIRRGHQFRQGDANWENTIIAENNNGSIVVE